ncbi:hypothetical protein ES703_64595 [subsurface metagenome]
MTPSWPRRAWYMGFLRISEKAAIWSFMLGHIPAMIGTINETKNGVSTPPFQPFRRFVRNTLITVTYW